MMRCQNPNEDNNYNNYCMGVYTYNLDSARRDISNCKFCICACIFATICLAIGIISDHSIMIVNIIRILCIFIEAFCVHMGVKRLKAAQERYKKHQFEISKYLNNYNNGG